MLLDNFVMATAQIEAQEQERERRERRLAARLQHPLDALLEKLTSEYVDDEDLSARIRAVFQARARTPGWVSTQGGVRPSVGCVLMRVAKQLRESRHAQRRASMLRLHSAGDCAGQWLISPIPRRAPDIINIIDPTVQSVSKLTPRRLGRVVAESVLL